MKKSLLFLTFSLFLITALKAQNIKNPTANLPAITTGQNNVSIGANAGDKVVTGSGNVLLGDSAYVEGDGNLNVVIGEKAGMLAIEGDGPSDQNVIIGALAASEKLEMGDNVFIGYQSGLESDKAMQNVVIGSESGRDMDDAENNVIIGYQAGKELDANDNVFIGSESGENTVKGDANVFVGSETGKANIDGSNNSFFGREAGKENTMGLDNTFIGKSAGEANLEGSRNTYVGYRAGFNGSVSSVPSSPSFNIAIGDSSGAANQGNFNTFLGSKAGISTVEGYNNLFLGDGAMATGPSAANISSSAAIGSGAQVAVDNAIILGDTSNLDLKVGIGTASPQHKLDVKGVVNMRVGFNSPAMKINNQQWVGLDQNGDFLVSDFKIKYNDTQEWSDKVFDKNYNLMPINELKTFVEKEKHLPNIPTAKEVVEEGVSLYEMTSKLLEKVEEQALYIIQLQQQIDELKVAKQK